MSTGLLRRLFGAPSQVPADRLEGHPPGGLRLLTGFVTETEQEQIAAWIATNVEWSCGTSHGNRLETFVDPARPLPEWGRALGQRMIEASIFDQEPDYLHLIAYEAGSGIGAHVDRDFLGEVVAGLTLGSSRVFEFTRRGRSPVRILLLPGDLYVISGEARHRWEHGVPAVKADSFRARTYPRTKGLSATWRAVDREADWISDFTRSRAGSTNA